MTSRSLRCTAEVSSIHFQEAKTFAYHRIHAIGRIDAPFDRTFREILGGIKRRLFRVAVCAGGDRGTKIFQSGQGINPPGCRWFVEGSE